MTPAEYRKPERELVGRRVRLRREIRTGAMVIPAGAQLVIEQKWAGLALVADECQHCGVRMRARKVPISDIDLLPREEPSA